MILSSVPALACGAPVAGAVVAAAAAVVGLAGAAGGAATGAGGGAAGAVVGAAVGGGGAGGVAAAPPQGARIGAARTASPEITIPRRPIGRVMSPPPLSYRLELLNRATGDTGDEMIEKERVDNRDRHGDDQGAGHERPPEKDIASDEVSRH